MKVIDDGIIKYDRSNFTQCNPIDLIEYSDLEKWRKILFQKELIGEYLEAGVGFGNLSKVSDYSIFHKSLVPQFVITGTQTGKYQDLDGRYYTRVLDYDVFNLKIKILGPIEASSEALTHASIYTHNKNIKVVFHIHSSKIWNGMIRDNAESTCQSVPYGTSEMAQATQKCIGTKDFGIFCMKGHIDGVVAYGRYLDEVGNLILKNFDKYSY